MAAGGYAAARRQYRKAVVNRGHGDEEGEESKYAVEESTKRTIDPYMKVVNKNTEFFTSMDPSHLLDEFLGYFEAKGF